MGNATPWYYLDAARERHGPVTAEVVAARFRAGTIDLQSLVWREGLSEWTPLGQLRDELDLPAEPVAVAAAAAAAPVATSAIDAAQPASAASVGAASEPLVAAAAPASAAPSAAASSVYSPPRSRVTEDEGPIDTQDVVQAGFLRRWVALFVDILILSSVYYAVFFALLMLGMGAGMGMGGGRGFENAMAGVTLIAYPLYFLFAACYYAGFESSSMQATPGKLVLGIKVVDREGRRLSPAHAVGRWVSASLSYLTLYIGFLMAAFTERKQALHDLVAGTQVVDRWAYTSQPEKQQRGTHGCVVAFAAVMGALLLIGVIGIIAAIAIPAYQDYSRRALRAVESPMMSDTARDPVPQALAPVFTAGG